MASCVRNICAKNYKNLIIGFQDTVENVGDVFLGHSVYIFFSALSHLVTLAVRCLFHVPLLDPYLRRC